MLRLKDIKTKPIQHDIAAISCGIVDRTILLDLIYEEDRGKDQFKVADFDLPHMNDIDVIINTSNTSIKESVDKIKNICRISQPKGIERHMVRPDS